jgi:PAS domain S-box-containing protein
MAINDGVERAYQELRESEELHRATLANISDAVFLTDDEGQFTFVCPNADVIFGYTPDEVRSFGRISGLLGENLFVRTELAERRELCNIEREVTVKSGRRRTVLVHVKAVSIKGATVLYTCRDVTDLRHAEEQLRVARADLAHASRLALVGELMASITHEVKQPLTAIIGNASAALLLLQDLAAQGGTAELRETLEDIIDEGRLAADIIDRLRALARKRPLVLQALDVNELVTDTLRVIAVDARRRHVMLRAELEPALPSVKADRVCIQHVLLSLALNAMDAMDHLEPAQRQVLLRTQRLGSAIELSVSDSGHGIPPQHLPRLFEAFFTTKKEGLGLGLAIAQSIVEAHQGRIWAEANGGSGATFRVRLPAQAPA